MKSIFLSALLFASHTSFAVGTEPTPPRSKNRVAAIARVEDGQVTCVKYAPGIQVDSSRLEFPLCTDAQSEGAMSLAISEGKTRTAWVTHAAFGFVGCAYGMLAPMVGAAVQSTIDQGNGSIALGCRRLSCGRCRRSGLVVDHW